MIALDDLERALETMQAVRDSLDGQLARQIEHASTMNLVSRIYDHGRPDIDTADKAIALLRKIIRWRTS